MNLELIKYKAYKSGSLEGFADFRLTDVCLEIYGAMLFEKDGKRWILLPQKEYRKKNGGRAWQTLLKFTDAEAYHDFQKSALKQLEHLQTVSKH